MESFFVTNIRLKIASELIIFEKKCVSSSKLFINRTWDVSRVQVLFVPLCVLVGRAAHYINNRKNRNDLAGREKVVQPGNMPKTYEMSFENLNITKNQKITEKYL